eukprot:351179-Chlamydomonas_euryale.AAC.4
MGLGLSQQSPEGTGLSQPRSCQQADARRPHSSVICQQPWSRVRSAMREEAGASPDLQTLQAVPSRGRLTPPPFKACGTRQLPATHHVACERDAASCQRGIVERHTELYALARGVLHDEEPEILHDRLGGAAHQAAAVVVNVVQLHGHAVADHLRAVRWSSWLRRGGRQCFAAGPALDRGLARLCGRRAVTGGCERGKQLDAASGRALVCVCACAAPAWWGRSHHCRRR